MRAQVVFVILFLFILGCASKEETELTQQQKDQIKKELTAAVDSIMLARISGFDSEGARKYYWDSPDFVAINPDGSRLDFQRLRTTSMDRASETVGLRARSVSEDATFMASDLVVFTYIGKAEFTLKSGDKLTYDPDSHTMIFRKIAGRWKLIHDHESATIVTQKAGMK
jgi:ketosteroid isomerase-like protein